jgi:uncharacterized membrane protein
MKLFHATSRLDKAFEIGLLLKAIDGLVEVLGGIFFLLLKPQWVTHYVHALTDPELAENPHAFVATHVLHWAGTFTKGSAIFAGLYLLSHGIVKLVLVVEILRNHLWAYIGLAVVTVGFILYQLFHIIAIKPSFSFIALTVFDVVIVYLTWREYGRQKQLRVGDGKTSVE